MNLFASPYVPFRGNVSYWADKVMLSITVPLLIGLIVFVLDASRLCAWVIRKLSEATLRWPKELIEEYKAKGNMKEEDLNDWLTIELIIALTKTVS